MYIYEGELTPITAEPILFEPLISEPLIPEPLIRPDAGILADIWEVLNHDDAVRSLDLGSLSIEVTDGEVYLDGYLARENNRSRIESIARAVKGVQGVHNRLITDDELIVRVAQALARDERTRTFILPVGASHGWISLGGDVPTRELQQAAEKLTAHVPGVRGVISLPRIAGESPSAPRRVVQPHIGAVVYGENCEVGTVTEVVIQPDNGLVTDVIVRTTPFKNGDLIRRERKQVIPVDAFRLVKSESLIVKRNGQPIVSYPVFDPDEYPMAPFTWKAPYPYTAGEVCWPLRQILEKL